MRQEWRPISGLSNYKQTIVNCRRGENDTQPEVLALYQKKPFDQLLTKAPDIRILDLIVEDIMDQAITPSPMHIGSDLGNTPDFSVCTIKHEDGTTVSFVVTEYEATAYLHLCKSCIKHRKYSEVPLSHDSEQMPCGYLSSTVKIAGYDADSERIEYIGEDDQCNKTNTLCPNLSSYKLLVCE